MRLTIQGQLCPNKGVHVSGGTTHGTTAKNGYKMRLGVELEAILYGAIQVDGQGGDAQQWAIKAEQVFSDARH